MCWTAHSLRCLPSLTGATWESPGHTAQFSFALFFKIYLFCFMYEYFACMFVYGLLACLVSMEVRECVGSPGTDVWEVGNHHVGFGNQIWVL